MVNYKKGQVWKKAKTKIMLKFEEETGKSVLRGGKITGQFEYWLWQQNKKSQIPKPKPKAKPKAKEGSKGSSRRYNYDRHIESYNLPWQLEDKIKSFVFKTYKWEKINEELVRLSVDYWKLNFLQDSIIEKHKVKEIEAKDTVEDVKTEIENYLKTHPPKNVHWIIGGNCLY